MRDNHDRTDAARQKDGEQGALADGTARRSTRWDALIFAGIAGLAFLVRLGCLAQTRSVVFFEYLIGDARAYDEWAHRLSSGDWLDRAHGVFYQAPLYPYFLAVLHTAFGHDLWWVRMVQIVLGSVACGLVFLAGRGFFSFRVGVVAGAAVALYAPAVFFEGLIQKESIGQVLMALLLWLTVCLGKRPAWARWCAMGLTLGLLVLVRENALLMVPVAALWLAVHFAAYSVRARWVWFAALSAGLGAVLVPVGVRNLVVGGEFALTTSQAGPNFYIGNNPGADGGYSPLIADRGDTPYERHDAVLLAERSLGRELTPREVSRYWFGQASEFAREHPVSWLRLTGRKLLLAFHAYEIPDSVDMYYYTEHSGLLRVLSSGGHFGVMCPLAAAGVVLTWRRRRELWILYLLMGVTVLGLAAFYVMARYRFPMMPIVILFAAAGVVEGAAILGSTQFGRFRVALLALLIVGVAANWPIPYRDMALATSHSNAGSAWAAQGEYERAIAEYEAAVRLNPKRSRSRFYLGKALAMSGRLDEAMDSFRAGLEQTPDDPLLLCGLATSLLEGGDAASAVRLAERACANTDYADPEALDTLAAAYVAAGKVRQAIDTAERGVQAAETLRDAELTERLRRRLAFCRGILR